MYLIIYGFLKICDNRENTVRQINILKAEAQADVQTQEALNVLRLPCGLPCVSLEEWSLEGLVNITRPDSIYLALSFSKYLLSNCKVSGKWGICVPWLIRGRKYLGKPPLRRKDSVAWEFPFRLTCVFFWACGRLGKHGGNMEWSKTCHCVVIRKQCSYISCAF